MNPAYIISARSIAELRGGALSTVPEQGGVYFVFRKRLASPRFLTTSPAGHYRGIDPTIAVTELLERWVVAAHVLYIGQASGGSHRSSLRARIRCYLRHGGGARAGHSGGRAIWQLSDSDSLLIGWETAEGDAAVAESAYIHDFVATYGRLPFANRRL